MEAPAQRTAEEAEGDRDRTTQGTQASLSPPCTTGKANASTSSDAMPLRPPGDAPEAPVSFKRRTRPTPLNLVRRWLWSDSTQGGIAQAASLPCFRDSSSASPVGWEHPAGYASASHVTTPTVLPKPESNPIPMLPYTVLCLLIFGEFCSAGVAGPFLFFMLNDFQIGDESRVGFWAGVLASVFFFAQFLTSLLWASAAEKHGRRTVLQTSLVGSTLSLLAFGVAPNLPMALVFRLAQGFFSGAVGVAKGSVRDLTDATNESRAYAQMGFCWGMGGIVGPILGGLLEHPAQKYPWLFGRIALLHRYPYVLPCVIAASFTALGAFFSLFLEPHAGPRPVRLPADDGAGAPTGWGAPPLESSDEELENGAARRGAAAASRAMSPLSHERAAQRTHLGGIGTSYGPESLRRGARQTRTVSASAAAPRRRIPSGLSRVAQRFSLYAPGEAAWDADRRASNLSLMERFVLANDDALLSATDLWVAAATHHDETDSATERLDASMYRDEELSGHDGTDHGYNDTPPLFQLWERDAPRRTPSYVPPAHFQRMHPPQRPASQHEAPPSQPATPAGSTMEPPPPASLWVLIPVLVVVHYGLLSFHASTFEQIFLAFLVTVAPSGGLGLHAGHYAVLVAWMGVCQLYFQFQLYPSVGPPHGRLSHLRMLQLGLSLYFPCYLLFPLLRTFLLPSTNVLVMLAMITFASLRSLANVFSFTSIMVLLNAWTPPHLVPLANGLAQTVSSAARCVGPIVGGMVWAQSIHGGPYARPWPFNYFLGFGLVGLVALTEWGLARRLRERS